MQAFLRQRTYVRYNRLIVGERRCEVPGGSRHRADEVLASTLATGATVAGAATAAGVSQATVYRRLQEPSFLGLLGERRAAIAGTIRRRLAADAIQATQQLSHLARSARSESVRLQAARAVVEFALNTRRSVGSFSDSDLVDCATRFYEAGLAFIPPERQPQFAAAIEQILENR